MTPTLALNGVSIRVLKLRVGPSGPWVADVELTEAPATTPSGFVSLAIGSATLRGTVLPVTSTAFGLAFGCRVVGGAAGWGKTLARKGYHNDAGIKARLVAEDAAREAGETLGSFEPADDRLGPDFARAAISAAATLERAAGGATWWVDYDGITHVGTRTGGELPRSAYVLRDFDEANGLAQLSLDDFGAIAIGAVLSDERLGGALVVQDLEVEASEGEPLRATAWCAGSKLTAAGRLPGILQRIVRRASEGRLFGIYRYRVVSVAGDLRLELQAVRAASGLPDLKLTAQWPGLPGLSAHPAPGAEVLVQFIDGDPNSPTVTAYSGPGGAGFVPTSLCIGGDSGPPAARQGDPVQVLLPPANFVGTIGSAPATGVVTWLVPTADGTITGGSGRVQVAT